MSEDPFRELGLQPSAGAADVRAARRRLAKQHHPDAGGDAGRMGRVNAAAAAALHALTRSPSAPTPTDASGQHASGQPDASGHTDTSGQYDGASGQTTDIPSFTVEALPAETFEALLVVVTWIGEVLDDDPPYRLDAHLREPADCWCRLELVPDAGASTVSITIARVGDTPLPAIEAVRDTWIENLNRYDW